MAIWQAQLFLIPQFICSPYQPVSKQITQPRRVTFRNTYQILAPFCVTIAGFPPQGHERKATPKQALAFGTCLAKESYTMRRQPKPRYSIVTLEGELGSIGEVVDNKTRRVKGRCSTFRDGPSWRQLLEIQCNALNLANKKKNPSWGGFTT